MTDFFTLCCKKHPSKAGLARCWARLLAAVLFCGGLAWSGAARAQQGSEIAEFNLERTDAGVFLGATLQFELPVLAEDALNKGIPLFFVAETEVLRERWYWYPQPVAQAARYMRLSYQPLTRRWRLAVSAAPISNNGLGVVLGQNYDGLADALAAMQRISRWKIADATALEQDVAYTVHLRFRLDMSQLPRPLQIGAMGRSGWSLSMARSQRLLPEHPP